MEKKNSLASQHRELEQYIRDKPRTQKEIADYFEVNRKTVSRTVDALTRYIPIHVEKQGRNTIYRIEPGKKIEFTPLELATLILSQEAIVATGERNLGFPFADNAKSLIAKVRAGISPALRSKMDSLADVYGSSVVPSKNFTAHSGIIEILVKAVEQRNRVEIKYQSFNKPSPEQRRVNPYKVYFDPDGATLKFIGFDETRRAIIPFSIDHIRDVKILTERFVLPSGFDLRQFLEENCFNGIHGQPIDVRLKTYGNTAKIFAERQFHPSQKILRTRGKSHQPDCLTVMMRVAGGRGLERFILSWLPEIEVIEPVSLRESIGKILQESHEKKFQKN